MNLETERLKSFVPFVPALLIAVLGWLFLISPAASESAGAARQLDALEQRLAQVRASAAEPPPPAIAGDPGGVFERQVAGPDVSSQVLLQLSRLASSAAVSNLAIETGNQVIVATPAGPQASDGNARPDPRFGLFDVPLAYSPILMSFDADYESLGGFLWLLRDFATTIEVRSLEIRPRPGAGDPGADGRVHAGLTLFAYTRQRPAAAGASGAAAG